MNTITIIILVICIANLITNITIIGSIKKVHSNILDYIVAIRKSILAVSTETLDIVSVIFKKTKVESVEPKQSKFYNWQQGIINIIKSKQIDAETMNKAVNYISGLSEDDIERLDIDVNNISLKEGFIWRFTDVINDNHRNGGDNAQFWDNISTAAKAGV